MVFSSLTFLLIFLPLTALLYYVPPLFMQRKKVSRKYKNIILCLASLIFYAWGEPVNIVLMIISILFNFFVGIDMNEHGDSKTHKKVLLAVAVFFDLGLLAFFKYSGFAADNVGKLIDREISFVSPVLPIGISFYTFQILSYVIDVYRGKVAVQNNLPDFALYISMFPQLIAGPIVQYSEVETQLLYRKEDITLAGRGVYLFILGLAEKTVLANAAGQYFDKLLAIGPSDLSVLGSWAAAVFYAFQIYFDFSGYSDMARGLGAVFGFEFPVNFDHPYCAVSVTDFWRRWHITLSSWFRDYVYIPLGGNRKSKPRTVFNLFVVWSLTGLWHGASWNFVLWGIYYFVLLVLEKFLLKDIIAKIPSFIRRFSTFFFVLIGWVFFFSDSVSSAILHLKCMFGGNALIDPMSRYYVISAFALLVVLSVFSTDVFGIVKKLRVPVRGREVIFAMLLLAVSLVCLIGSTYNPFLYFRF